MGGDGGGETEIERLTLFSDISQWPFSMGREREGRERGWGVGGGWDGDKHKSCTCTGITLMWDRSRLTADIIFTKPSLRATLGTAAKAQSVILSPTWTCSLPPSHSVFSCV